MKSTIQAIIAKANKEGCVKGSYVKHIENSTLFSISVELNTGTIMFISYELIQDFQRNSNISVCNRIKIMK